MKTLLLACIVLLLIASCKDKETPKKVTSITINPSAPAVRVGETLPLTVAVLPADAAQQAVKWTSADPTKATVDAATGVVTGVAVGTTTITAAATDGSGITGTATLTVTARKATSVTINPSAPAVRVGETLPLTVAVLPADAAQDVIWTSSDQAKATVDAATGTVTGIAIGGVTITAAADGSRITGTVTLTVTARRVASIAITPSAPSVRVGESLTLSAAVLPADATQAVSWTSADPAKATIDASTGAVTGVTAGTVAITASATDGSGITGTATLTITGSNDASVSVIALDDENFPVAVPAAEGTTAVANAPRTVASDLTKVKVNITAAANASIKIGDTAFTPGQTVNFSAPVTFTVTAQDGTTVKRYSVNITPYNKDTNPYGIYTVKHLVDVANGLTASYLLKNNIDLPNADAAGVTATGISDYASAGWLPLGTSSAFTGTFDGGGFSINNFYINRTANRVGFFGELGIGALGDRGTIKSLSLNGTTGTAATGRYTGGQHTGILAGFNNEGIIDKCYATGNVSSSSSAGYVGVGGLVGGNSGIIRNCYATGNISSSSSNTASAYAGGLAGSIYSGSISHSYATGNVSSSTASTVASAGGLAGGNLGGTCTNSYRNRDAIITKKGIISASPDDASVDGITAKTKAEMQDDAFTGLLNAGASPSVWGRSSAKNDGLPYIIGVGIGK